MFTINVSIKQLPSLREKFIADLVDNVLGSGSRLTRGKVQATFEQVAHGNKKLGPKSDKSMNLLLSQRVWCEKEACRLFWETWHSNYQPALSRHA